MNNELLACKHHHKSFVQSGSGTVGRHRVYICADCGRVMIIAYKDGVSFDLSFHVDLPEQLDMMRKWTDYVGAES